MRPPPASPRTRSASRVRPATGGGFAADPVIDVVAIAAPNPLHADIALAAIAAGKAVYCEKPLSVDIPSARAMRDAARAAGTCTMVGLQLPAQPPC